MSRASKPCTLPAGRYYIGDLCYVIGRNDKRDDWMDFLTQSFFPLTEQKYAAPNAVLYAGGPVEYKGHAGFCAYTAYGDGRYYDGLYEYPVDAGIIGAIPVDAIEVTVADAESCGRIVQFDRPFQCYRDNDGVFTFGDLVEIDTDPREEEDDYYNDEEDDY